jgi:hypothetical protein
MRLIPKRTMMVSLLRSGDQWDYGAVLSAAVGSFMTRGRGAERTEHEGVNPATPGVG